MEYIHAKRQMHSKLCLNKAQGVRFSVAGVRWILDVGAWILDDCQLPTIPDPHTHPLLPAGKPANVHVSGPGSVSGPSCAGTGYGIPQWN